MITIKVSDYYIRCGVRAKGKEFYKRLLGILPEGEKDLRFDFKGVTFVSSSFLEESIFRLVEDYNISIVERARLIERKAERIISWKNLNVEITHERDILTFRAT